MRYPEIEVVIHIAIKIEFAFLDQLHDRGPREGLGNGSGPEERARWRHGSPLFYVGVSVAFAEENIPVLHDHNHGARDVFALKLLWNQAVEKSLYITRGHFMRFMRRFW